MPGISSCTILKSQNFTCLSADPVTRDLPSGWTCSDQMELSCAWTVSMIDEEATSKSSTVPALVPTTTCVS